LNVLDEQRDTPRGGLISYVDLSQGKRAVVGFTSGRQVSSDAGASADNAPDTPAVKAAVKTAAKNGKEVGATKADAKKSGRARTD
jgi:hypothetical protein